MIDIIRTGYCEGCEYSDVKVNPLYGNGKIVELFITCEHEHACRRAYDFGVLDACKRKEDDRK